MRFIHDLEDCVGYWLPEAAVICLYFLGMWAYLTKNTGNASNSVYANYFYDASVIFSNSIITDREPFTICIGHDRRTDVIGIDWY